MYDSPETKIHKINKIKSLILGALSLEVLNGRQEEIGRGR